MAKLLAKLKSKKYRDLFVAGQIKTGIPFQLRAMRDRRGWTQEEVGKRAGLPQSAVARLENPDTAHAPNIKTLLKLASAFDVALIVRYACFSELVDWTESRPRVVTGLGPEALAVKGFDEDFVAVLSPPTASETKDVLRGSTWEASNFDTLTSSSAAASLG